MSEITFHKFGHTIEVKKDGKLVGGYTTSGQHSAGSVFLWAPVSGWTREKVQQAVEDHLEGTKKNEWKI